MKCHSQRVLLGSNNNVSEDVHMDAALRHCSQAVHGARNLASPMVHPGLLGQLPDNGSSSHTLLQAAELHPNGHLNLTMRLMPDSKA